jgi:hypothetical protein
MLHRQVLGLRFPTGKDAAVKFIDMCKEAGWFATFEQVHLIYLSPEDGVCDLVTAAMLDSPRQARSCAAAKKSFGLVLYSNDKEVHRLSEQFAMA